MAREKFQYSFARKRLADNKLKFYQNGKQILTPINSNFKGNDDRWNYPDMISQIKKGVSFMPELKNKSVLMRDYDELLDKTGLMISSRRPTMKLSPFQKVEYYLCMKHDLRRDMNEIPVGHNVEVDFVNRKARLRGGNSNGKWITFQKKPPPGEGYYSRPTFYGRETSSDELMEGMFNIDEQQDNAEPINIPEIIVGTSLEDGRLVTMPEENFNPIIFICGKRRQGKNIFAL